MFNWLKKVFGYGKMEQPSCSCSADKVITGNGNRDPKEFEEELRREVYPAHKDAKMEVKPEEAKEEERVIPAVLKPNTELKPLKERMRPPQPKGIKELPKKKPASSATTTTTTTTRIHSSNDTLIMAGVGAAVAAAIITSDSDNDQQESCCTHHHHVETSPTYEPSSPSCNDTPSYSYDTNTSCCDSSSFNSDF